MNFITKSHLSQSPFSSWPGMPLEREALDTPNQRKISIIKISLSVGLASAFLGWAAFGPLGAIAGAVAGIALGILFHLVQSPPKPTAKHVPSDEEKEKTSRAEEKSSAPSHPPEHLKMQKETKTILNSPTASPKDLPNIAQAIKTLPENLQDKENILAALTESGANAVTVATAINYWPEGFTNESNLKALVALGTQLRYIVYTINQNFKSFPEILKNQTNLNRFLTSENKLAVPLAYTLGKFPEELRNQDNLNLLFDLGNCEVRSIGSIFNMLPPNLKIQENLNAFFKEPKKIRSICHKIYNLKMLSIDQDLLNDILNSY